MRSETDVRRISLSLTETIEKSQERRPGFRVKGKLFARLRESPDGFVVWGCEAADTIAEMQAPLEQFSAIAEDWGEGIFRSKRRRFADLLQS